MSYPGSKGQSGVFQLIIGNMPPHSVYVEAFAGSAQIFTRKRKAAFNIVNDLAYNLPVNFWPDFSEQLPEADETRTSFNAVELLKREFPSDTVIYCDPPYMLSTRKGRRYYKFEMEDWEHEKFLAVVLSLDCRVLISHPPTELYKFHL